MKNLHELSEEYAQKIIDKDTYRSSRRELIKKICSGQITLENHEYLPPLPFVNNRENAGSEITQVLSVKKAAPQKQAPQAPQATPTTQPPAYLPGKKITIGAVIIASLCVCIIALISYFTTDKPDDAAEITEQQVTARPQWRTLINDFVKSKNWQQSNMEAFLTSWQQLPENELSAAAGSPEMKRITNAIYQRLLVKRALLNLHDDTDKVIAEQKALVDFATELGIVDERITVVEN